MKFRVPKSYSMVTKTLTSNPVSSTPSSFELPHVKKLLTDSTKKFQLYGSCTIGECFGAAINFPPFLAIILASLACIPVYGWKMRKLQFSSQAKFDVKN